MQMVLFSDALSTNRRLPFTCYWIIGDKIFKKFLRFRIINGKIRSIIGMNMCMNVMNNNSTLQQKIGSLVMNFVWHPQHRGYYIIRNSN